MVYRQILTALFVSKLTTSPDQKASVLLAVTAGIIRYFNRADFTGL